MTKTRATWSVLIRPAENFRYDPASRNFMLTDIGCAKPSWVPVNG